MTKLENGTESTMFEFFFKLFTQCIAIRNSYAFTRFQSRFKFWKKQSFSVSKSEETYSVTYIGNVPTFWAKGESCFDAPLKVLWRNYERKKGKKAQTKMKLTICNSGLKASTRDISQVEYWSNKITSVTCVPTHPRVFLWIYRHTGKRGRPDLRCHAVVCKKSSHAKHISDEVQVRLYNALREFKRELNLRQVTGNNTLPTRKKFLVKGSSYFKQPLERSQSAPKLDSIVEDVELDDSDSECPGLLHQTLFSVSTGQLYF